MRYPTETVGYATVAAEWNGGISSLSLFARYVIALSLNPTLTFVSFIDGQNTQFSVPILRETKDLDNAVENLEEGQFLLLDAGTFKLSTTLSISNDNVRLQGSSEGTVIECKPFERALNIQ